MYLKSQAFEILVIQKAYYNYKFIHLIHMLHKYNKFDFFVKCKYEHYDLKF